MKTLENFLLITILTLFLCLGTPNVIEGNLRVTSCNCTECCYQNNSDIHVRLVYQFADDTFGMNMTGNPIEIGKPSKNCSNYIQNFEWCAQTSSNTTDNTIYRYLDFSQGNSSIGSATIVGNVNDQSYIQFVFTQNEKQCEIIFNYSRRRGVGLIMIVFLIAVIVGLGS